MSGFSRLPRVLGLALLVGTLALADAAVISIDRERERAHAPPVGSLLTFNPVAVHKLTLTRDKRPPLILERQGAAWVVASHRNYPVRAGRVESMLQRIASWRRERVAGEKASHETFAVTPDRAISVRLDDAQNRAIGEILLGTLTGVDPEAARQQGGHVDPSAIGRAARLATEDAVYVVQDFISGELEPEPAEWLEKPLVAGDESRVRAFALRRGLDTVVFHLDPQDPRTADGRPLDVDRARALVHDALALAPTDVCSAEEEPRLGLHQPRATFEVVFEGSTPAQVALGDEIAFTASAGYPGITPPASGSAQPVVPARVAARPPVLVPAVLAKRVLEAPADLSLLHVLGERGSESVTRVELTQDGRTLVLADDRGWSVSVVGSSATPRKLEGDADGKARARVLAAVTTGLAVRGFERGAPTAHGLAAPRMRLSVELGRKDRRELAIAPAEGPSSWVHRADLPSFALEVDAAAIAELEAAFHALAP